MVLRYKRGKLALSAPFVKLFFSDLTTDISRKSFLNAAGLARETVGFTLSGLLSSNVVSVALEDSRWSRGEAYFNNSWSAVTTGFVL